MKSIWMKICILLFGLIGGVEVGRAEGLLPANEAELEYSKNQLREIIQGSDQNQTVTLASCALATLEGREANPDDCGEMASPKRTRAGRIRRAKRIVNGVATHGYPSAGALLIGLSRETAAIQCSGTLISSNKFLTAAHCIEDNPNAAGYWVFFQHAGSRSVAEIDWPEREYQELGDAADIAVLTLNEPVHVIRPTPVNKIAEVIPGTNGVIIGFGRTGGSPTGGWKEDYGIKRFGFVETDICKDRLAGGDHICWNFSSVMAGSELRSNTCNADSGGGLVNTDGRSFVVGITTAGELENCGVGDHSWDLNIFRWKGWIAEQVGTESIAPNNSVVVDPRAHVLGDLRIIGGSETQIEYDLEIAPGTSRFAVAMNGEDDGTGINDFDLFLIRGLETSFENPVCREDGIGQFAYCEVLSPAPGPWRIIVKAKRGKGLAQITVTRTN